MPSKARRVVRPKPWHVEAYRRWLHLKQDPSYRAASNEIKDLESKEGISDNLTKKKEETCRQFDLITWAHPDDNSVTYHNADAIVRPQWPVYAISPWRKVTLDPKELGTRADEDGWLTLKVNLLAPLPESEEMLRGILRAHRRALDVPKDVRQRAASNLQCLEVWESYENERKFTAVARHLRRKVSTVKGQYVRGYVLVFGSKPTGSMKQRRLIGIGDNPGGEFESHLANCSRCHRAETADQFCQKYVDFVKQDHVSLRESLPPDPIR